jgi:HK97 family phage major capsid protein
MSWLDADPTISQLRSRMESDRASAAQAAIEVDTELRQSGLTAERRMELDGSLEFSLQRIDQLTQRLGLLPKLEVVREPDIYERGGPHGFFADIAAVTVNGKHEQQARARLERHDRFEADRCERLNRRAHQDLAGHGISARGDGAAQSRALSTQTLSWVPPRWMTELWANVSVAACPLKGLVTRVDLPDGTLELVVPRFDAAAGVVTMQYENVNLPAGEYEETDEIVTPVCTFGDDALLSQQLYERSPLASDEIILNAVAEAYGARLQQQLTSGTGTAGQMLGLINVSASSVNGVPGAIATTYTDPNPTVSLVASNIAQCAASISDTRERSPSVCLMRGPRWYWFSSSHDTNFEPMVRPGTGRIPADADLGPYGPLSGGLPVYHDNTLPTNLGSGSNQDVIVLARAKDIVLLEDPAGPRFSAMPGSNLAGQLTVILQWHAYVASIPNRYPSSIGTVSGTGLVIPFGWAA